MSEPFSFYEHHMNTAASLYFAGWMAISANAQAYYFLAAAKCCLRAVRLCNVDSLQDRFDWASACYELALNQAERACAKYWYDTGKEFEGGVS